MLGLDSDIDSVVCRIPEIFYSVLEGRIPAGLARLGKYLFCLAIFVRAAEMPGSENNDHASHMRMQARLLMRPVMDVHHLYILILESQTVMRGLDLGGILRERHGGETQTQPRGAEHSGVRRFPHERRPRRFLPAVLKLIRPRITVNSGNGFG